MPSPEEIEAYEDWLRRTGRRRPGAPSPGFPSLEAEALIKAPSPFRPRFEPAPFTPGPTPPPRFPPGTTRRRIVNTLNPLSTTREMRPGFVGAGKYLLGALGVATEPINYLQDLLFQGTDIPRPTPPGRGYEEALERFRGLPLGIQLATDPTLLIGGPTIGPRGARAAAQGAKAARQAVPLARPVGTALASTGKELDAALDRLEELRRLSEAADLKAYEAKALLDTPTGGQRAPKFGTSERSAWEADRMQSSQAGMRIIPAKRRRDELRAKARQAKEEADTARQEYARADEDYSKLLGEPVTDELVEPSNRAIQAGMGIGEKPSQGTLGLGGRTIAQEPVPLIDAEQVAQRQRLAAERAAGQQALPGPLGTLPPPPSPLGPLPPTPPGGGLPPRVPRGPVTPPPSGPTPATNLVMAIPGENPASAAVRKYAGTRNESGLETQAWVRNGDQFLSAAGITKKVAGRPIVPMQVGDDILKALHGEGSVPPEFGAVVIDLKAKMAQETADMLAADPSFSKRMLPGPDYFPRMWKLPQKTPQGRPQLGNKPFFFKQRGDLSYSELRNAGFEPVSFNPYDMLALRRMAGTDYRDGLVLVKRLKQMGRAIPLDEVPALGKDRWRVPEVGPAFEGRPFPTQQGTAAMTQPIAVPNNIASMLEGMFGKRPSLEIAGKDIVPAIGTASQAAKRTKLFGSLFQFPDFAFRVGAEALSPTAILNGTTVNFPRFLAGVVKGQFSEASRAATRQRLLSDSPIIKGTGISLRMLVQEGMEVGGDTSIIRRDVRSFLDNIGGQAPQGMVGQVRRRVDAVNRFFEKGLFENMYPLAQEWAAKNHVVPVLKATHPSWTDEQIAGQAAKDVNIMFSSLASWQTIFSQPAMRELARTLIFSTNESEGWIRSALATVRGPSKRLWIEHWIGLGILLAGIANIIHKATTGNWLPSDRYNPIQKSPYGPAGVNYNPQFLAPDIPLKDNNGENINLDLMGQADTVFHFVLDPVSAIQSRENVIPRAIGTQVTGRGFGGKELTTIPQRLTAAATELAAPIGAGELLQAHREESPRLQSLLSGSEVKLGAPGHFIQATGVNVRSPRTDIKLLTTYQEGIGPSLQGKDKEIWEAYHKVSSRLRPTWLKSQPFNVRESIKRLSRSEDVYRSNLRKANPMLDVLLVERGSNRPVTEEGKQRLAEIQTGVKGTADHKSQDQIDLEDWRRRNPVLIP